MARPNSYGSRANRERRQAVAKENQQQTQVDCTDCKTRHREGRHYQK